MAGAWSPDSWRSRVAEQQPSYPDADELAKVLAHVHLLPPLVTSGEIETLKEVVAMHRRSGTPEDSIKKLPSYIRLQALEGQTPKE